MASLCPFWNVANTFVPVGTSCTVRGLSLEPTQVFATPSPVMLRQSKQLGGQPVHGSPPTLSPGPTERVEVLAVQGPVGEVGEVAVSFRLR